MSPAQSDTCARCGASARTTPHTVLFDDHSRWTAVLCPRHYSQVIDFLELALSDWEKAASGDVVVPVVTNLDLPAKKKRGRPRKVQPELQVVVEEVSPPVKKAAAKKAAPAKKVAKKAPAKKPPVSSGNYDPATVRAWAEANGVEVSQRGRISTAVVDAWRAAEGSTGRPVPSRSLQSARNKSAAKKRNKASVLFSASGG